MAITSELEPAPNASVAGGCPHRGFEVLFVEERRAMVRLAYLLVGSEDLAEEVVQDAFAQVYERWDRLDQPGAYLRTCVVNGARRSGRRLRRERDRVETPAPAMLEAREMLDALGHLRPTWRAVGCCGSTAGSANPRSPSSSGFVRAP